MEPADSVRSRGGDGDGHVPGQVLCWQPGD